MQACGVVLYPSLMLLPHAWDLSAACFFVAYSWLLPGIVTFWTSTPPMVPPRGSNRRHLGGAGGVAKRLRALFHATSCASKNNEFVRDILQKWPLALPGNPFAWNNALPSVPHLSLDRHRSVSCSLSPPSPPPFPPSPSPLPLLFLPFPCPSSRSKDG